MTTYPLSNTLSLPVASQMSQHLVDILPNVVGCLLNAPFCLAGGIAGIAHQHFLSLQSSNFCTAVDNKINILPYLSKNIKATLPEGNFLDLTVDVVAAVADLKLWHYLSSFKIFKKNSFITSFFALWSGYNLGFTLADIINQNSPLQSDCRQKLVKKIDVLNKMDYLETSPPSSNNTLVIAPFLRNPWCVKNWVDNLKNIQNDSDRSLYQYQFTAVENCMNKNLELTTNYFFRLIPQDPIILINSTDTALNERINLADMNWTVKKAKIDLLNEEFFSFMVELQPIDVLARFIKRNDERHQEVYRTYLKWKDDQTYRSASRVFTVDNDIDAKVKKLEFELLFFSVNLKNTQFLATNYIKLIENCRKIIKILSKLKHSQDFSVADYAKSQYPLEKKTLDDLQESVGRLKAYWADRREELRKKQDELKAITSTPSNYALHSDTPTNAEKDAQNKRKGDQNKIKEQLQEFLDDIDRLTRDIELVTLKTD